MHLDLTISLGSILTIVTVLGIGLRLDRQLAHFLVEHEILIADYCKRSGISTNELPTRIKSWR